MIKTRGIRELSSPGPFYFSGLIGLVLGIFLAVSCPNWVLAGVIIICILFQHLFEKLVFGSLLLSLFSEWLQIALLMTFMAIAVTFGAQMVWAVLSSDLLG